jgi:hypothetical protein
VLSAQAARPRQRPVAAVVANVVVLLTGAVMVRWEIGELGAGSAEERLTAWCFLLAGVGAVAGAMGAWMRARWARAALALWIAAMAAGFFVFERVDAGLVMALGFVCAPLAGVAWYLDRSVRREPDAASGPPAVRAAIPAPLLILLALAAPPIVAAAAALGFAAAGGESGMIALVLLVPAQLAFIVALARRAASTGVRAAFVAIALISSIISTLVVLLGSAVG